MADVIMCVNSGLSIVTGRIKGSNLNEPNWLHFGTGLTAPVATNTALEIPRTEARVQGASSLVTTNAVTNDTYQVVAVLTCSGTAASVSEVGQFDASVAGNMLIRGTFSPINLNPGDSIQFTSQLVISR